MMSSNDVVSDYSKTSNPDEIALINHIAKELRRCYKLSDFLYRKNFQFITGTDCDPI